MRRRNRPPTRPPEPTADATSEPTAEPTAEPTSEPTAEPTADPTPTDPTAEPTDPATAEPTDPATATDLTTPTATATLPTWEVTLTGGDATLTATLDGMITIGGETRAAADIGAIVITGSDLDDHLTLDLRIPLTVPVDFDGGLGSDTLVGPAGDVTWQVTAADAGNVSGVDFASVENLQGAADNEDTFVVDAAGSVSGTVDGGVGGFDSLVFDSDGRNVHATAIDRHSGSIALDGVPIAYVGLEPISNTGSSTDMVFDLGALPDFDALLTDSGGSLSLTGTTFESTTFSAPTSSLTINGGGSRDKITISGAIALLAASLIVAAEEIVVTGTITTTGDVTLTAADSISGGVGGGALACVVSALFDLDPATGDGDISTALIDNAGRTAVKPPSRSTGGLSSGAAIAISATSSATPDEFKALVPRSSADVTLKNGASVNGTGNVSLKAVSTVTVNNSTLTNVAGFVGSSLANVLDRRLDTSPVPAARSPSRATRPSPRRTT